MNKKKRLPTNTNRKKKRRCGWADKTRPIGSGSRKPPRSKGVDVGKKGISVRGGGTKEGKVIQKTKKKKPSEKGNNKKAPGLA